MKLESVADWMAHFSWRLSEARIVCVGGQDEDFALYEEYTSLEEDAQSQLRMLCKRANLLADRAKARKGE